MTSSLHPLVVKLCTNNMKHLVRQVKGGIM